MGSPSTGVKPARAVTRLPDASPNILILVSDPRPVGQRSAGLIHQRPVAGDGIRIIAGGRVPCPTENRAVIADGSAPGSMPRLGLSPSRQRET
jgi:hypothetical protein